MFIGILKVINCVMFSVLSVLFIELMIDKAMVQNKKIFILQCFTLFYVVIIDSKLNDVVGLICMTILFIIEAFIINRQSLIDCITYALLATLIFCISDEFSSVMVEAFIDVGDTYATIATWMYALKYVLFYFIVFSFIVIINLIKTKLFNIGKTSVKTKIMICVVFLLQIITIISEYFVTRALIYIKNVRWFSLISYMSTFLTIVIFYYIIALLIEKDNKIEKSDELNLKIKTVNDILKHSFESQRKINHEHGNNLAVLSGYIENKDYDKAVEYIGKIIGRQKENSNEHISNIKECGLRSLLAYKYSLIKCRNIDCEIFIDENIYDTIIPSEDLNTIVAIFLDNAIDAASESEEPFVSITITKKEDNSNNSTELNIIIENTIKNCKIDKKRIFESGYSTKGQSRGYGLNIVKDLVDSYAELDLNTDIDYENLMFSQKLRVKENKNTDSVSTQ